MLDPQRICQDEGCKQPINRDRVGASNIGFNSCRLFRERNADAHDERRGTRVPSVANRLLHDVRRGMRSEGWRHPEVANTGIEDP